VLVIEPRNDDTDMTDTVVTFRDRSSGRTLPIGTGGKDGRAVLEVHQPPYAFPAVAVEDDVLAFLEPEIHEGDCTGPAYCDKNSDGDAVDQRLRVYKRNATSTAAIDMTANLPAPLAADAGLVINDRSLAVSNGRVFVRVPENAAAPDTTIRLSQDANGNGGNNSSFVNLFNGVTGKVSSADGRYLVFESTATNLLEPATTTLGTRAVFRYDRDANGDGVFDETAPGGTALELVSVRDDETQMPGSTEGVISSNGRFVAFYSYDPVFTGLSAPCVNSAFLAAAPCGEIMLRDTVAGTTEIVSLGPGDVPGNGDNEAPSVSADGRFVAFQSSSTNLEPGIRSAM
jgi:hypothetical protein